MQGVNWTALIIFIVLFGLITILGFAAAHWRKGDLDQLHEWGLGGRLGMRGRIAAPSWRCSRPTGTSFPRAPSGPCSC